MMVFLFRCLARLPLGALHALGWLAGWVAYASSAGYRRRIAENLQQAGYVSPVLRRQVVGELGRSMFELPYLWMRPSATALEQVEVEGWEYVEQSLAQGRGVVMLSPHIGSFELVGQYCAQRLTRFTALYRPHRKASMAPLVELARGKHLELASADMKGVRKLMRALKQGEAIGILPDQVPSQGDGVWVNFFERPAYTMTLPAKLIQSTQAVVMLAYCLRVPLKEGKRYRMIFQVCQEGSGSFATLTPEQLTTQLNQAMEQVIRSCPEQYLWSYNRYKKPAGSS